jgi:hypothetical protein
MLGVKRISNRLIQRASEACSYLLTAAISTANQLS